MIHGFNTYLLVSSGLLMIFVGIIINSFSQRGYEIIELLCFEILGGTLVYGGFSGGTYMLGGPAPKG